MKWMAVGEIGAFILGLVSAIFAVMFLSALATTIKVAVFIAAWFLATKYALWLVHLGYNENTT